ncbi:unnamed protein product [marine sediment metagenome]|uniref:Uncharacterized protein n=1 Tax=marine sediment metagenome TaxID=412755 RepID=X0YKA5_9ZZZZ
MLDTVLDARYSILYTRYYIIILDLEKKLCYTIFDFMGLLYISYNDL